MQSRQGGSDDFEKRKPAAPVLGPSRSLMLPRSGAAGARLSIRSVVSGSCASQPGTLPAFIPVLSRWLAALCRCGPPGDRRQMPRKGKAVKGQPSGGGGGAAEAEASGPVTRGKSGAVTITVHAKPGSKHSTVTEVSAEAVGVAIAAPPTDGEANAELIRYLAEVLDMKKSHISLDKGSRSRDKLIRVDCSLSPEEVLRRLRQAVD